MHVRVQSMCVVFVDKCLGSGTDSKKGELVYFVWANLLVRAHEMDDEGWRCWRRRVALLETRAEISINDSRIVCQ